MATIVEYKVFVENEFEHRINLFVKYRGKSYAVSITTFKRFDSNRKPVVEKINSFMYLNKVARKSDTRDMEIKRSIIGMNFEY